MIDVDVIVTSMNEPQLDRCLRSLREQTYPFFRIININGVSPFYVAWNRGVSLVSTEWFSLIGGDCIYQKDALERVIAFMKRHPHEKCCGYCFSTYDPFLEINAGFLCVVRAEPFKQQVATDSLCFDRQVMARVRSQGWFLRKNTKEIVGTHFESPDEFQVFHRFFILATKDGHKGYIQNRDILKRLYDRDKKPLQALALYALEYGINNPPYGRSIDEPYNLQMYEDFKKWIPSQQLMP